MSRICTALLITYRSHSLSASGPQGETLSGLRKRAKGAEQPVVYFEDVIPNTGYDGSQEYRHQGQVFPCSLMYVCGIGGVGKAQEAAQAEDAEQGEDAQQHYPPAFAFLVLLLVDPVRQVLSCCELGFELSLEPVQLAHPQELIEKLSVSLRGAQFFCPDLHQMQVNLLLDRPQLLGTPGVNGVRFRRFDSVPQAPAPQPQQRGPRTHELGALDIYGAVP